MISISRSHLPPIHIRSYSDRAGLQAYSSAISLTSTPAPTYCTVTSTSILLKLTVLHCPAPAQTDDLSLAQADSTISEEVKTNQLNTIRPFAILNSLLQLSLKYS